MLELLGCNQCCNWVQEHSQDRIGQIPQRDQVHHKFQSEMVSKLLCEDDVNDGLVVRDDVLGESCQGVPCNHDPTL